MLKMFKRSRAEKDQDRENKIKELKADMRAICKDFKAATTLTDLENLFARANDLNTEVTDMFGRKNNVLSALCDHIGVVVLVENGGFTDDEHTPLGMGEDRNLSMVDNPDFFGHAENVTINM